MRRRQDHPHDLCCIAGLHAMLNAAGDWVQIGGANEQKPAKEGTVEAWGRSTTNPVSGWYGIKKGFRGRFAVYIPPLMEALGFASWSTRHRRVAFGRGEVLQQAASRCRIRRTLADAKCSLTAHSVQSKIRRIA
jgi:hypothetical protein